MSSLLGRLGWLCAAHPWRVIAGWTAILVVLVGLAWVIGDRPGDDYNSPGSSASPGDEFLARSFPELAGADARVMVRTSSGRLNAADLAEVRDALRQVGGVSAVSPPRLSSAGDTALIAVHYRVPATEFAGSQGVDALRRAVAPAESSGLEVELGGEVPENFTIPGGLAERASVVAAACVLVVAFGSIAAAGIPAAVGLFGVGTGLALLGVLAGIMSGLSVAVPVIATLLGISVGVSYTLLLLARFREDLPGCGNVADAAGAANRSAGTAIVVAATTVAVSLLGLRIAGIGQFATFGYAMAVMVAAVTAAAVTVGPAVLGVAGYRLVRRDGGTAGYGWSSRWGRVVDRRPAVWAVAAVMVLVALAAPVLGMRTWPRAAGGQSTVDTARRAYDVIAAKFGPGVNGPFTVAVDTTQLSPTQLGATITELQHDAGVAGVTEPVYNADGSAAVLMIEPTTAPHEQATVQTLRRVRGQLPRGAYVAGLTVYFADISERVTQRLWLLITVVVGVGMVALAIALKAPVVAIKAALTSLLAMAATYGVLIALFQWGWGAAIFGLSGAVPLSSWAVILLFIVLFALSTTYEIFLVSRVREEWLTSGEARASVMRGLAATAPVGVSGAAIMVAGFLAFALDPDIVVKMLCVGAVVGVLINAVVIRMVLAPATMQILGAACWWCPGRRGR